MAGEDSMRTLAARADRRLTYDDFVRFPDDLWHQDLVGRLHVETAVYL